MVIVNRSQNNPILTPRPDHFWEAEASFNGCPVFDGKTFHLLYRAQSRLELRQGRAFSVSSIGYAQSKDGERFSGRRQFIAPEEEWERFGCEDPRVTKLGDTYFISYTALSQFPFVPEGIKIAIATTKDFQKIFKHPATHFNSKAMVLFPEKISGKIAALLTVHTDRPPSQIALALFDKEEDLWSPAYWKEWYAGFERYVLFLKRSSADHVEIGAPPLKTKYGWLLVYSYIQNYFTPPPTFGVEAVLLDLKNPLRIIGRTRAPLLVPQEDYERYGKVHNITFPSGAVVKSGTLLLYYGGADTVCAVAKVKMADILKELAASRHEVTQLTRSPQNPIIAPRPERAWEAKATFNPGAFQEEKKIHIFYRAMSQDNTSVIGYAASEDGSTITERNPEPVYAPREQFEEKLVPGGNSGCEDPRLTLLGERVYMCYTAFDGKNHPRVALTSIAKDDLIAQRWNWRNPVLISPPGADDKDAALFPRTFDRKFAFLHRLGAEIWIDMTDSLNFDGNQWLKGSILLRPDEASEKIGISTTPIETPKGWLLLYHGITKEKDPYYYVSALLLDRKDPRRILARLKEPLLIPEASYEKEGHFRNVVFPCGTAIIKGTLFVYYGGGDKVIGVASMPLQELLDKLVAQKTQ